MRTSYPGFTIVELLVIIVVIATLAAINVVGYGAWRHDIANTSVVSDVSAATSSLNLYRNFRNDFPPNLGGTGFAPSQTVALKLYTNAPQKRTYSNLTPDQNAQLFLNSCNGDMPITSGGSTYNTSCTFAGNNVHVAGQQSSNVVINGPTINQSDFVLTCGSACNSASADIINQFTSQGGNFPISVPKNQVSLPQYALQSYGAADKFCLEGTSADFSDIIYHTTSGNKDPQPGACPNDPTLHYP